MKNHGNVETTVKDRGWNIVDFTIVASASLERNRRKSKGRGSHRRMGKTNGI